MSREIKFRAWDNAKKEWTLNIMECVSSRTGNIWMEPALKSHKVVIEQYTGLKDKNGKEIYEGDIVEYDWYIMSGKPAYRVKKQVVFDDMGARVGNDRIRNCSNVEVVGNIHENKDLLDGSN